MNKQIKNSNLNIRIDKELKDKFIKLTKENGTSYSKELRYMIEEYIITEETK